MVIDKLNIYNFVITITIISFVIITCTTIYYIKTQIIRDEIKERHFYITYLKMKTLFKKFNIEYVSSGGTLLGAIRDSKFLPWDYDMDFCTNYDNKDILFSDKFKREAKKLKLKIEYYEEANFWGNIGGLKICNGNNWEIGQIDIFFFSNKVDKDIFYLGNDGKPHMWENHSYKIVNLLPLREYVLEFPTINKFIKVPCPNKSKEELSRHFGEEYMLPPANKKIWYLVDNILYSKLFNIMILLILIIIILSLLFGLYLIYKNHLNFSN